MHISLRFLPVLVLGGIFLAPRTTEAVALDTRAVAADAQWILHLDADKFRDSRIGTALLEEFSERARSEMDADVPLDPALIVNGLRGITLYGSGFEMRDGQSPADAGVAVVAVSPELLQVVQGMIAGIELEQPERIAVVETSPVRILQAEGIFGAILENESRIVIGKALPAVRSHLGVRSGELPSVDFGARFGAEAPEAEGFFLGVFAEGINRADGLPAQARVLQLTEGVSLQLGEVGERMRLNIAMRTDSTGTANQVRLVLQGIVALVGLTQSGQPELQALINSASFAVEDRVVRFGMSYPVEQALTWVDRLADMSEQAVQSAGPEQEAGIVE